MKGVKLNPAPGKTTFKMPSFARVKLIKVVDLLCSIQKLRLKDNLKHCIDSEIISAIRKRDTLLKNYKKSSLQTDKDHFRSIKMALQKIISKKRIIFFKDKSKTMLLILKYYGKLLSL